MAASIRQRRPALGARILEHIFPWLLRPWLLHCICIKVTCQCRAAAAVGPHLCPVTGTVKCN